MSPWPSCFPVLQAALSFTASGLGGIHLLVLPSSPLLDEGRAGGVHIVISNLQ